MHLTGKYPCYNAYLCADGRYVSIGPLEAWFWERMVKALAHTNAQARRMVIDVESPLGGNDRQLGLPIKVAGEKETVPRRPPRLGEHDDEILAGIGYTAARIEELRTKGVIRGKRG